MRIQYIQLVCIWVHDSHHYTNAPPASHKFRAFTHGYLLYPIDVCKEYNLRFGQKYIYLTKDRCVRLNTKWIKEKWGKSKSVTHKWCLFLIVLQNKVMHAHFLNCNWLYSTTWKKQTSCEDRSVIWNAHPQRVKQTYIITDTIIMATKKDMVR